MRLSLSPNPFAAGASPFEQRLLINDGYIKFTGANNTLLNVWVDVFNPVIHIEIASDELLNLTASFETWRTAGYQMTSGEQRKSFFLRFCWL